jgi:tyrosine-protein kinase Etk/Wzc
MSSPPDTYRPRAPKRRVPGKHNNISMPPPEPDSGSEAVALKAYLHVLRDHLWLVLAIACSISIVASAYALMARPVYEASMMIHVEEVDPAGAKNALTEVSSMFETKKAVTAEMELLRSRTVLAPAIERLGLTISARPDYFPLLGRVVRDARPGQLSQPGLFGIGGKVWGSERIEVSRFNVPTGMLNRDFVITSLGDERFSVFEPRANIVFYGRVGPLLRVDTPGGMVELQVAQLVGRPGARFLATRQSTMAVITQLQTQLFIGEQGKQSGVIAVRLEGSSAEGTNALLTEIGRQYMDQNMHRKSDEAEKSLAFLDQQMPKLKARLEHAEGEYNTFRHANGTIDFAEEAKQSLQQATAAKMRRTELVQKRAELLTRFTSIHPMVAAVSDQLREVDGELTTIAEHIKRLPLLEQDALRLSREIKVSTDLYTALANTAQQLRIASVGRASNVRLVDAPMVIDEPIRPHRKAIVAVGAAIGILLGVAAAFLRRTLTSGVDDPLYIEKMLGARVVFASIPRSEAQIRLNRRHATGPGRQSLLALDWPTDGAIEALRSFRASLQFSMPRFENNVIMFAGPTSSLGKSFITANMAVVMAAGGKRVLLVDADVRNGRLHQHFGTTRENGLCEVISGAMPATDAIRCGVLDNLDLMPTGRMPANHPDFFKDLAIGALLKSVSPRYDMVLVDSPPILALADALVLGSHAGAVFLIVRAGVSTEREITESIKRLNQAGVSPYGILFNDVKPRLSAYGYRYGYGNVEQLEYAP